MFDDRLYKRGAITLHAIRLELGDTDFFGLLHAWTKGYRHGSVTGMHFADLASSYADVSGLLAAWLDSPRLPPMPKVKRRGGLGRIR
jgi:aminopeptidase